MGDLLGYLAYAAGLAAVMYGIWQFAALARRRRVDNAMMNIIDELFHPVAHEQQVEHRIEEERMVPRHSADDDDEDKDKDEDKDDVGDASDKPTTAG